MQLARCGGLHCVGVASGSCLFAWQCVRDALSYLRCFCAPKTVVVLCSLLPHPPTRLQYDRARVIYKYGLDKLGKERSKELFKAYTQVRIAAGS